MTGSPSPGPAKARPTVPDVGKRLVAAGVLDPAALAKAETILREQGGQLLDVLLLHRLADERALLRYAVGSSGLQFLLSERLRSLSIGPELLERIPAQVAERLMVVPLKLAKASDTLAVAMPGVSLELLEIVRKTAGVKAIQPVIVLRPVLRAAIRRFYFGDLYAFDALGEAAKVGAPAAVGQSGAPAQSPEPAKAESSEVAPAPRHERTMIMGMPTRPAVAEQPEGEEEKTIVPPERHERTMIMGMPTRPVVAEQPEGEEEKTIVPPERHERTMIMGMPTRPVVAEQPEGEEEKTIVPPERHGRTMIMGMPTRPAVAEQPEGEEEKTIAPPERHERTMIMGMPTRPAVAEQPEGEEEKTIVPPERHERTMIMGMPTRPAVAEQPEGKEEETIAPPERHERTMIMGMPTRPAVAEPTPPARPNETPVAEGETLDLVVLRLDLASHAAAGPLGDSLVSRNQLLRSALSIIFVNGGIVHGAGPNGLTALWGVSGPSRGDSHSAALAATEWLQACGDSSVLAGVGLAAGAAFASSGAAGVLIQGPAIEMAARLAGSANGGEILVSAAVRSELAGAFRLEPRTGDSVPGEVYALEPAQKSGS